MAASSTGISTLTFGVPTKTGFVIQSFTKASTPAVAAEVTNELGQRVHARYDDVTDEITVEALIAGATLPLPGQSFAYDGETYETLSVEVKGANNDFRRVTIKGKTSEYI